MADIGISGISYPFGCDAMGRIPEQYRTEVGVQKDAIDMAAGCSCRASKRFLDGQPASRLGGSICVGQSGPNVSKGAVAGAVWMQAVHPYHCEDKAGIRA